MQLQTKLRLTAGIAIAMVAILATVASWSFWQLRQLQNDIRTVEMLRTGANEIYLLTAELSLHRSERAAGQWQLSHRFLESAIEERNRTTARADSLLKQVEARNAALGPLFERLLQSISAAEWDEGHLDEPARIRFSRILRELGAIQSLLAQVEEALREHRERTIDLVALLFGASVLVVVFGAGAVSFRFVPALVRQILTLRRSIQAIGAGNLLEPVVTESHDELGDVFREVERMRESLLASTRELQGANRALEKARAELEQRVQQRTAELSASNKELEAFAYSVSHDLHAPLRSMAGFCRALEEDYGEALDEQARDYMRRITAASKKMAQLIDDIITLSKVSRKQVERVEIDLSALAEEVAVGLTRTEPKRDIRVAVAPGVSALGDSALVRIVLQNLLDNAWKFTAKQPEARVEVGATTSGDTPVYFVRDNGAGFDMRYADKLFRPFQRLHSDTEFEGTGIGLASVAQIVQRHGGEVWAESEPGKGSTLYFTLQPGGGT